MGSLKYQRTWVLTPVTPVVSSVALGKLLTLSVLTCFGQILWVYVYVVLCMCVIYDPLSCQTLHSTLLEQRSPVVHYPILQFYLAQEILGVLLSLRCALRVCHHIPCAFASDVYVGSEDLNLGHWA